MWVTILGIVLLIVAAVVESYCTISRQSLPSLRAKIFDSSRGLSLYVVWMVLLVIGATLLFSVHTVAAIVGVVVFWVLLPMWLMPILKRRMLPPWDMVKGDLEQHGYTEDDYLDGDWWKKKRSKEIEVHFKSK